jgi:hypothetical protein
MLQAADPAKNPKKRKKNEGEPSPVRQKLSRQVKPAVHNPSESEEEKLPTKRKEPNETATKRSTLSPERIDDDDSDDDAEDDIELNYDEDEEPDDDLKLVQLLSTENNQSHEDDLQSVEDQPNDKRNWDKVYVAAFQKFRKAYTVSDNSFMLGSIKNIDAGRAFYTADDDAR